MTAGLVLKSLAIGLAAMVLNVAVAFAWVALYSLAIAPGQGEAAYQAYALRAVPWSAVIAGVPILVAAGWLLARWLRSGGWRSGIGAGVAYVALDVAILVATGTLAAVAAVNLLSWATKLAAAALGGAVAARRAT